MKNHNGAPTTTMSVEPQANHRRLVLFPLPLQGHINPMLQLANILYSKGFKITIIHTQLNSPNQSNHPHFTFKSISDGLQNLEGSSLNLHTSNTVINFLNKSCIKPFKDCMARLLEEEHVACLISDSLLHFTQSVADGLNLPRIVLRTSSMSCVLVYASMPLIGEKGHSNAPVQEKQVPELETITKNDMLKILNGKLEEGKLELISNMIKETKKASGIIWNTFKDLEEPAFVTISQDFIIPSFPIGPFHKYFPASSSSLLEQDRSFITWLDAQPTSSVVYVSFGSIAQMGEPEFTEMAWGLASSKQRFLWVVRPGSVSGSKWLESLPEGFTDKVGANGCIVKWAPQQEVLSHHAIGAFWTHNGWNSTLESVCEGVPMICSPCSYDQPINARYVTDVWRIGIMLENKMEREEIGRVIKRVIVDKEGNEMRGRCKAMQEKVKISMEKGGSANEYLESLVNFILSF